jgi:pyridoxal phosphate-dependent aminotransferase EpsN
VLESNWLAPLGPEVDAFEREMAERAGVGHAVALVSGTAALHLALELAGVEDGDEVLCPTLTFAATAFAITYLGAKPAFLDVTEGSWTVDPALLVEALELRAGRGRLPAAVIPVDLYGQCCDYEPIVETCGEYGVPVIEDAAEALGASYQGRPAGGFGRFGVFSFNGNKIITTSGGGMLVSDDGAAIARARFLASQARDPAPHYQHSSIGYNYRMSNLLAAVGRVQLAALDEKVAARRAIFARYVVALGDLPGIAFMPEPDWGRSTRWLTCLTVDPKAFGADREAIRLALEEENIESRPVWKPMHLQPVFHDAPRGGGEVAERLFREGLCLPSGSGMTEEEQERVCGVVRRVGGEW